jgi:8-oxo-dGTP diphosphatase
MKKRSSPAERPILAVGAVVTNAAGEVLLVRRGRPPRQGEWSIPGGKVEWGETLEAALRREIREETGLEIEILGFVAALDSLFPGADGETERHYVLLDYAVLAVSGTLLAGDDASEVRWVTPAELETYEMWSETRRIIEAARALF